ncbi:Jag N-terminal domain-containing protein [Helicobacter anatolicus]|uniref:Jag N-terminal domain-containing protein n=1 Tax=Helicobacter anatolicus TaxID=2905874 RepID=UPI001E4B1E3A|nr:Jag N-terminal domain-containing protein [Helicobacter anatolicus]MCE3039215.1 Jag N-terminal domain-containing protein [Helicobacter anatolicus]
MKKISAPTLQEAITQAAIDFNCSVIDLEYEIIQQGSRGFLGIGKKPAIIVANVKNYQKFSTDAFEDIENHASNPISADKNFVSHYEKDLCINSSCEDAESVHKDFTNNDKFQNIHKSSETHVANSFASFQEEKEDVGELCKKIEEELKKLLSFMPYEIDRICVTPYDKQTLKIFLDGKDSALLIGEKGYRYKALSYLLFNWIWHQYHYNIRLEVAHFLQMQEEIVEQYIQNIQKDLQTSQTFKTKPLYGIFGVIMLKRLREIYPGRYITLKQEKNEQYIIISCTE